MDKEKAALPAQYGIDYADALERFGGDAALYERLALKYAGDSHLDRLEHALSEEDVASAYREAHSLKGVAGNLSFTELYQAAARISEALNVGNLPAARAALPFARHAHENVIVALKQLESSQTNCPDRHNRAT